MTNGVAKGASSLLPADKIEAVVERLVTEVWTWGESCGVDGVRMNEQGDSHNEWMRANALKAKDALYELLAASPLPAPQEPADDGKAAWDHTTWAGDFQRLLDLHWEAAAGSRERTRKAVIAHVNLLDNKASLGWKVRAYAAPAPVDPESQGSSEPLSSQGAEAGLQGAASALECHGLDTPTRVRFYEHDFYVLSNFSAFTVVWDGRRFQTSEHLYHYLKFNTTALDIADAIFAAPSAHEAFKLAEQSKPARRKDWDAVKVELMLDILRLKAAQHGYVRRKLLATGDRELVEDSWRDDYWGWGPNRDGKNMLGRLWMQVRDELRGSNADAAVQNVASARRPDGHDRPISATQPASPARELTDAELTTIGAKHLEAYAQFVGAGEVWVEGEVDFARAVIARDRALRDQGR